MACMLRNGLCLSRWVDLVLRVLHAFILRSQDSQEAYRFLTNMGALLAALQSCHKDRPLVLDTQLLYLSCTHDMNSLFTPDLKCVAALNQQ